MVITKKVLQARVRRALENARNYQQQFDEFGFAHFQTMCDEAVGEARGYQRLLDLYFAD